MPDNVDPEEIKRFDAVAADWWDPEGSMRALHHINPLRLDYIQQFSPLKQTAVMDVGCGAGLLSEAMAKSGAHVLGIDLSGEAIKAASAHAVSERVLVDYQQTAIETIAQARAGQFDVITCMEMLEHVPDPASIIRACYGCLKPGGRLFLSTINRNLLSYLGAIVVGESVLKLLPKGTHEYAKLIKPSELNEMAEESGFHLLDLSGMHYQPFTKTARLTRSVWINYLACYARD